MRDFSSLNRREFVFAGIVIGSTVLEASVFASDSKSSQGESPQREKKDTPGEATKAEKDEKNEKPKLESPVSEKRVRADLVNAGKLVFPKEKWVGAKRLDDFLIALPDEEILSLKKGLRLLKDEATTKNLSGRVQDIKDIHLQIVWRSHNILLYPFVSNTVDYHYTLQWLARQSSVASKQADTGTSFELERLLMQQFFADLWDKLTPAQREELINKVDPNGLIKDRAAVAAMTGAAAVAALSGTVLFAGFAFYTTMSVSIATVAGFFGLTVPFAVYAGASSLIAFLSGPVGWALIGLSALAGTALAGRANARESLSFILAMHVIKVEALRAADVKEDQVFSAQPTQSGKK